MTGTELQPIPTIFHSYKVADAAAMAALTGMKTGEICYLEDTLSTYRYSGAAWELVAGASSLLVIDNDQTRVLQLANQSSAIAFTDLDLTAYTSADAKVAILQVYITIDAYTDGVIEFAMRKNGTTPATMAEIYCSNPAANDIFSQTFVIGLDADEICEYMLNLTGTAQVDINVYLWGYLE